MNTQIELYKDLIDQYGCTNVTSEENSTDVKYMLENGYQLIRAGYNQDMFVLIEAI